MPTARSARRLRKTASSITASMRIRSSPRRRTTRCILVTRGNDAKPDKPEDPGAIKTFGFANGALTDLASIAPRHRAGLRAAPSRFSSDEAMGVRLDRAAEQALCLQARSRGTGLSRAPMFVKDTLANPNPKVRQAAGAIHVHPSGKFVYLTNRASDLVDSKRHESVHGGENNVAVFAIDQASGEPTLIQNADGAAVELRTFGIEPSGRMLVAASIKPVPVRDANGIKTVPAKLCVFSRRQRRQARAEAPIRRRHRRVSAVLERHGHARIMQPARDCNDQSARNGCF